MLQDWLLRYWNFGFAETSAQVCRRLPEQLRPLPKHCGSLRAIFSQQWFLDSSGSYGSTTTRHFIYHTHLCYSHTICYIIICLVLFMFLYIYTYGGTGTVEMDSATESIQLGDPGIDRYYHIIRNTSSFFPRSWSHAPLLSFHRSTHFMWFLIHSCQAFIDPRIICGSSWPDIPLYPATLFIPSLCQNGLFWKIIFECYARCSGVLMMCCQPSSSTVSPHLDWVNLDMCFKAVIVRTWRL